MFVSAVVGRLTRARACLVMASGALIAGAVGT